jgi:hypothetical protein
MKLNPLLVGSAALFAAPALALIFAPSEVIAFLGAPPNLASDLLAQLLGAALFGLSVLNWFQRYATVSGVLGRPVLLTNLVFVTVSFFTSVTAWRHVGGATLLVLVLVLGSLFLAFGSRLFRIFPSSARSRQGVLCPPNF